MIKKSLFKARLFARSGAITCLAIVVLTALPLPAEIKVPSSSIAIGKPLLVDSDEEYPNLNARVDIGTMRQDGDEIEVEFTFPYPPGDLEDLRKQFPKAGSLEGAVNVVRERVLCTKDKAVYFSIGFQTRKKDGTVLGSRTYDVAAERKNALERKKGFEKMGFKGSYASDPRSLVCWAAARKCDKQDFTWPPPKNETPLNAKDAQQQQDRYNARFVPGCRLVNK